MTEKKAAKKKATKKDPEFMFVRNIKQVSVSDGEEMIAPGNMKKVKFVIGSMLLTCGVCEEITQNPDDIGVPE